MRRMMVLILGVFCALLVDGTQAAIPDKLNVLLVYGQNNHRTWPEAARMLETMLTQSGRFEVTLSKTPSGPHQRPSRPPQTVQEMTARLQKEWEAWDPVFASYDVVVSAYNGVVWPDRNQKNLEAYMKNGGGLVIIHAANNAFPDWVEYNKMIGVGGWYGRNEKSGPYLSWKDGKIIRHTDKGSGGMHNHVHEFVIENRRPEHPIMAGLPTSWLNGEDELFWRLRGPAENVTVLATAFSAKEGHGRGSGRHEPIILTIDYHKGRVFHTMLGHHPKAMTSVGFQETLLRGTEWAATGKVTFPQVNEAEMPLEKAAYRKPEEVPASCINCE